MTLGLFFLALQQISHQTAVIYYACAQGKGSLVCMKRNYSTGRSKIIRVALGKAKDQRKEGEKKHALQSGIPTGRKSFNKRRETEVTCIPRLTGERVARWRQMLCH